MQLKIKEEFLVNMGLPILGRSVMNWGKFLGNMAPWIFVKELYVYID